MTGPTKTAVCSPTATMALALGSSSVDTSEGRMLPLAGQKNESAIPNAAAMAKNDHTCTACSAVSRHRTPTRIPLLRWEQSIMNRGDHLSVTAPPTRTRAPLQATLQIMTSAKTAAE